MIEESLKKEIMLVVLSALLFAGVLIYLRKEEKINCKALCNKKNVLNQVSKAQI